LLKLRPATRDDAARIAILIDASVRGLQLGDYSQAQIDASLGTVFGVDRRLIEDGTYFVAELEGELAGCGGWSFRRTMFGGDAIAGKDDGLVDPATDPARIRAFFVSPRHARKGIGRRILAACEAAAAEGGFKSFELIATLTGEKLYAQFGYEVMERMEAELSGGLSLPMTRMRKLAARPG